MYVVSVASDLFDFSLHFISFFIISLVTLLFLLPDIFTFLDVVDGYPASFRYENTPHRHVSVNSPEERESEQSAWVPILFGTCEAELEEVSVHEREYQLTRRQLLKPCHLHTNEELFGNTRQWCPRKNTPLRHVQDPVVGHQWSLIVINQFWRVSKWPTNMGAYDTQ